jgi:hypothetical protein
VQRRPRSRLHISSRSSLSEDFYGTLCTAPVRRNNVTPSSAERTVQPWHETFPKAFLYRCVPLGRDSEFDTAVIDLLKATGRKHKQTSVQAP